MPDGRPYDVILDADGTTPLGLMLARDPGVGAVYRVGSSPGQETTEDPVYINGSRGAGFTEQYEPGSYGYGEDVDTLTHGVVLPAGERVELTTGMIGYPDGTTCSFEWGSDLYLCCGRAIYKVTNGTSTTLSLVHDLGTGVSAQSAVVYQNLVIIGTYLVATGAPDYIVTFDGTTFTAASGGGGSKFRHLAVVQWDPNGVPNLTLVGTSSTYQIRWCTVSAAADIRTAANWTTALTIGDSFYHIRKLIAAPRHVWAAKQEGVFDVVAPSNSAVMANITPHWRDSYDIENGSVGAILNESLYVSHAYGIDRIPVTGGRQDIPEPIEFGSRLPFSGPIYGRCVAMCAWRGLLFAAFYNSTQNRSDVMIWRTAGDGGQWHGAYSSVTGRITFLAVKSPQVAGVVNSYLWIGVTNDSAGTYHIYRQYVSKAGSNYQDLLAGGSPRFQTSFRYYVPDGWDAPTSRRVPYRYDVHADRLGGSAQVSVYANFDRAVDGSGDPSWTLQGTVYSSPRESFVPASVTTSAYRVDFKLEGQGAVDDPPVLRAFQPRADVNREQDPVWEMRFWMAQHQATATGADTQDSDVVMDSLWALQSENATPVTMISPAGNQATVQVLPGITVEYRENRDGEWGKLVTLRVRVLYGVWYWDSGVPYDSGRIWS